MLLAATTAARAFDFSAPAPTGQLVYYELRSNGNVAVVSPGWNDHAHPTGCLELSATVVHNGVTFTVTEIGANAFNGCDSLTAIVIPEGVTSIGLMAFAYCSALDSIVLPTTLTSLGSQAFNSCAYMNNPDRWSPDKLLFINSYLIAAKPSITGSVRVPEGTQGVGNMAFYYCYSMEKVTLPSTLRFIGALAFQDCMELDTVAMDAVEPPTLGTDVFLNDGAVTITVPCHTEETYHAADGWADLTVVEICLPDDTTDIPDPPDPPDPPEGVTVVETTMPVSVVLTEGSLELSNPGHLRCTVSDLLGRLVAETNDDNAVIPLPSRGVYLVATPGSKPIKILNY